MLTRSAATSSNSLTSSSSSSSAATSMMQQPRRRRNSRRKKNELNNHTLSTIQQTEDEEETNYGSDVFLHFEDINQESEVQQNSRRGNKRKRNHHRHQNNRIILEDQDDEEEFQTPFSSQQPSSSQEFEPSRQNRRIQNDPMTPPIMINSNMINDSRRAPPMSPIGDNNSANAPIVIEDEADVYRHHGNSVDDAIVLEDAEEEEEHQSLNLPSHHQQQQPTQPQNTSGGVPMDIPFLSSMLPPTLLLFQHHPLISPRISLLISSIARLRASHNDRPSTPARSNNLSKIKYQPPESGDKEECTICLCEFEKNKKVYKTGCGHMFHVRCLDQWFRQNTNHTCPNCRSHLVK